MKKILLFAGTTEGRVIAEKLSRYGVSMDVCVATLYGKDLIKSSKYINILEGRLDLSDMKELMKKNDYQIIIDATHPYATDVSKNIKEANEDNIPYLRIKRDSINSDYGTYFDSYDEMIAELKNTTGNILLTTGSKELNRFASEETLRNRLYVRIIPGEESIRLCKEAGIEREKIIAMQGPFSIGMNRALIDQYDIKVLVTKESGTAGGFLEKVVAAKQSDAECYVLRRPKEDTEEAVSIYEAVDKVLLLNGINKKSIISLVGIGMDGLKTLTLEAKRVIEDADIIYGASRMVNSVAHLNHLAVYKKMYLSHEIVSDIECELNNTPLSGQNVTEKNIVILYSGDTGFYSGASGIREEFLRHKELCKKYKIKTLPGISSLSMMAAKCNISYENIEVISSHGVREEIWKKKLNAGIIEDRDIFLLTSGKEDVRKIIDIISGEEKAYLIYIGKNLSYEDEELKVINVKDLKENDIDELFSSDEGLYSMILKRIPEAESDKSDEENIDGDCTYKDKADDLNILGIRDEEFLRDEKTPMTKEEVREIIVSKLRLRDGDIFFDIGSGTGSIAIQASLLKDIEVFAVEEKTNACLLIKKNIEKFGCRNISVFNDRASNVIDSFPMPDTVFIGGSGGEIDEIIAKLRLKKKDNKAIRVVISTVTLETEMEIYNIIKKYEVLDLDIVEVNISKARKMGRYNLMKAENPIKIISFKL